jgi:hypothetical protein
MMDIARPDIKRKKRRRQIVVAVIGVALLPLPPTGQFFPVTFGP